VSTGIETFSIVITKEAMELDHDAFDEALRSQLEQMRKAILKWRRKRAAAR
jgi:hypothetical protein